MRAAASEGSHGWLGNYALRRKTDRGCCANADFALPAQAATVHLDKRFHQRQTEAGAFVFPVEVAVDLLEGDAVAEMIEALEDEQK